jgi:hypothetical protein
MTIKSKKSVSPIPARLVTIVLIATLMLAVPLIGCRG